MIVSSLCPTSLLVNLDTANERVVRHRRERNHELPARIRRYRELLMLAMFSPPAVAKRARFQRHRIEYEKVASSHEPTEESEAALPGYNIPSSSFAGGCSSRESFCSSFSQFAKELSE
jgi:hypothetical protein